MFALLDLEVAALVTARKPTHHVAFAGEDGIKIEMDVALWPSVAEELESPNYLDRRKAQRAVCSMVGKMLRSRHPQFYIGVVQWPQLKVERLDDASR